MTEIKMLEVKSSNVKKIGWEKEVLRIQFNNDSLYEYYDVPESIYEDFKRSASKGRYVSKLIAKTYRYKRIDNIEKKIKK
jgi:hypothetical protein